MHSCIVALLISQPAFLDVPLVPYLPLHAVYEQDNTGEMKIDAQVLGYQIQMTTTAVFLGLSKCTVSHQEGQKKPLGSLLPTDAKAAEKRVKKHPTF